MRQVRARARRVINAFPFNIEFDMLELRFAELSDVVDVFLILESNYTAYGTPKSLHLLDRLRTGTYPNAIEKVAWISWHSTTPTRTPTRPTWLQSYIQHARFPELIPEQRADILATILARKSARMFMSHSTTPTPTSSPTSPRGPSRECQRVVQLATGIT